MRRKVLRNAVFSPRYAKNVPVFSVAGKTRSWLATWGQPFLEADREEQTHFIIFGAPGAGKTKKIEEVFLKEKM